MNYKTGLVLSGGGTRGYAQIGAIKAIEESGIEIDIIAGTSVGAIVAVMLADGYSAEQMYDVFSHYRIMGVSRPVFCRKGLMSLDGLKKPLRKYIQASRFEELQKPLYVTVTNLSQGKAEYIHEGPLDEMIVASASIPVIYTPISYCGELFTDGGLMDNFPVTAIRHICDRIIGINVMPVNPLQKFKGLKTAAFRTLQLYSDVINQPDTRQCDILIEPGEIAGFGFLSSRKRKTLYQLGYRKAKDVLMKNTEYYEKPDRSTNPSYRN